MCNSQLGSKPDTNLGSTRYHKETEALVRIKGTFTYLKYFTSLPIWKNAKAPLLSKRETNFTYNFTPRLLYVKETSKFVLASDVKS